MKPLLIIHVPYTSHRKSMNQVIRESKVSQALRRKLRHRGIFKINGITGSWDTPLQGGDMVEVFYNTNSEITPEPMDLSIIYEDSHILVLNKPQGILVHPTSSVRHGTLANGILQYFIETKQMEASFHPVHRLDKDTSGLIIIAKNSVVQHAFTTEKVSFQKVYDAIVDGPFPTEEIALHWPIARKEGSIIERCCHPKGQPAHTDVRLVKKSLRLSHLRCLLHTGRTHQIRVHLSALGYPITGDDLYGGSSDLVQEQALHASEIYFVHPMTGEEIRLRAPLPSHMRILLQTHFVDPIMDGYVKIYHKKGSL